MGRSPCCEKAHTNKGMWTKEEDELLVSFIRANGEGCWRSLPRAAGLLRCGKSCRLRWINYLRPDLKRGNFTDEEDEAIIKLHGALGNKWSLIAARLPGRTDNEIKNYWNTHIKRKLLSRGVDPQTHHPLIVSTRGGTTTTSAAATITPSSSTTARKRVDAMGNADQVDSAAASSNTSSGEEEGRQHAFLNLDLSLGLPSSAPPSPAEARAEAKVTHELERSASAPPFTQAACFCYPRPSVDFFTPMEGGQHIVDH